jgi:cytochrome P450 family 103
MGHGIDETNQAAPSAIVDKLPVLKAAELDADPHGVFRHYRHTHPVIAHEAGGYIVLRYADVERLNKDPRARATGTAFPEMLGVTEGSLFDAFRYGMLTAEGETHRRRRSPFSHLFAARMIAELRPRIRSCAGQLIDDWYPDGRVELVEQFAAQVPARIISDLLGMPREDIPSFAKLVYDVTRFISLSITPDEIPVAEAACLQLRTYVEEMLDSRRRAPRGDFLSQFLVAADEAAEMSPFEMVFQILQLIVGGTDTTRVAIVMQLALLLQHRPQWDAVCRDPSLIPAAVAEALRFEPSVASTSRLAAEDIEVGGTVLPTGSVIGLSTMSAMRDDRAYAHPDVFDIYRGDQPRMHPIFGAGAHRCIGEALARVELEESLAALAARIPQLEIAKAPQIRGHVGIRRVDSMYLSW